MKKHSSCSQVAHYWLENSKQITRFVCAKHLVPGRASRKGDFMWARSGMEQAQRDQRQSSLRGPKVCVCVCEVCIVEAGNLEIRLARTWCSGAVALVLLVSYSCGKMT